MELEDKMAKYLGEEVNEKSKDLDFSYLKKVASKKLSKLTKELQNEIKREDATGVMSKFDELKSFIEKTEKSSGIGR